MTDKDYLEQAEKELEMMNQIRDEFMADNKPLSLPMAYKYVEVVKRFQNEDTTLNVYELYKHPEARAKLFAQLTEACYMVLNDSVSIPIQPTQEQRQRFEDCLEEHYNNIIKKMVVSTDKQALGELLDFLQLPEDIESQVIRDIAVSGLLMK
ncbi:hypothetical protein [Streptococcus caballi]|uniref:hypothetical protein n=1 Tax=Streptococcus caballi TaxID=439220 RepID=UPI000370CDFC|nr:hypothetical protein [Streptococcus caballi]QBX13507.1 hypothetical protein JavanS86_0015 [Streptococcus satellite phage Javan86]